MTFQDVKNILIVWFVTGLVCGVVTMLAWGLFRGAARLAGMGG